MTKECECAAHSAAECVCGAWDEPPQRTWVGLTKNEVEQILIDHNMAATPHRIDAARDIETKLREKNT